MPNTRKKVIKTVYKDEDSEAESGAGDFSDSGSDAKISDQESSDEDDIESDVSSGQEFTKASKRKITKPKPVTKKKFVLKEFIGKIKHSAPISSDNEETDATPKLFSIKDLTEADKLLPSVLNLSESDSSEDESPKPKTKAPAVVSKPINQSADSEDEVKAEYKDVWAQNIKESEEVAKRAFMELEIHKNKIEETKESIFSYTSSIAHDTKDVKDLLAQGEEVLPQASTSHPPIQKSRKKKIQQDDSESEMEDWEEVNEVKGIPQEGLKLVVGIPDVVCRRSKKLDIEMMMKRKMNRVKKEHQVFMHKVHVLCWIGHGNYVSRVLNDQDIMATALSLVPSKECYPGERVDMKYLEQITAWYKDKLTLVQDRNEDKFRPKAPPLKTILLAQMKSRKVSAKKYLVYIFVSMLRAIGLQCRVMLNFVTLPLKPPSSELCSLSTKSKEDKDTAGGKKSDDKNKEKASPKVSSKSKTKSKIPQLDGHFDESSSDTYFENIMQLDGNDDNVKPKTRSLRTIKSRAKTEDASNENDDVSPPKRAKKSPSPKRSKQSETLVESDKQLNKLKETKRVVRNKAITPSSDKIKNDENKKSTSSSNTSNVSDDVSPPKRVRKSASPNQTKQDEIKQTNEIQVTDKLQNKSKETKKTLRGKVQNTNSDRTKNDKNKDKNQNSTSESIIQQTAKSTVETKDISQSSPLKTRSGKEVTKTDTKSKATTKKKADPPKIVITNEDDPNTSKYFKDEVNRNSNKINALRPRSRTNNPDKTDDKKVTNVKSRTKSAPGTAVEKSKYFEENSSTIDTSVTKQPVRRVSKAKRKEEQMEDSQRVSHRDLAKNRPKANNDVTNELVSIIKGRVKEAKETTKRRLVKGRAKESDRDSDFLPEEDPNHDSDDDFKPTKISPKPRPSTSRKIDRRVISSDDDTSMNKTNVWCEVFVEELEQWVAVDVIKGKVHCTNELYSHATHPVCYVVGWDNTNYLKDLTRRYVPHWNTVTRKQRAESAWWDTAVMPWLGPKTARDREEDEQLNRMQLEAPLPKSIAEYKNHPLYALKRHLLKFEAIYPPDAATLGFVRHEPVYARECVYVCRSRDIWLKEAKVVRMGEKPYKIVKARPKWDKLSNQVIKDKLLELFGPWQVQDYEPPVAENGVVPRNAYGNVELFKPCMLPKGTAHVKLPGLNRVAKKLNIDCAPAMTGFDFNGGWSHPVYDGFVVCKEFEEVVTAAWVEDQEEQERREREKIEARVYGNWKRLIKGLFIRERLKSKYGFEEPSTSQEKKKPKGPRFVAKKN